MAETTQIPFMGEHESAQPDQASGSGPGEYQPTPEEKKAIKLGHKLLDKAKRHRAKYDGKWLHWYKMFRGKQWKDARPSYRHSEVINMVFQSIEGSVGMMTDSRPRIEFNPRDPSDLELSEILNDVLESDWERYNWDEVIIENLLESHLYSIGLGYVGYDPKANYGEGAICFESTDPFYFYPDPSARDIDKKARFHVEAEPVEVEALQVEYPDKAKFIKPDLEDFIKNSKTETDEFRFKSPVDNKTLIEGDERPDQATGGKCLKITVWMKPEEIVEEKKSKGVNPETGLEEFLFEQKLKYPKGRKLVIAGGVLLEDATLFDDQEFPFGRVVNYVLPREFYGISDVEQTESPQQIFNKLVSFALDVLTMMGNPIWVVSTDADVDTDNLFNSPGMVVEPSDINKVRREEGVQLQPFVLQLIDRMRDWFDGVQGNQEVSQGVKPEGVSAASAITALQDAAQTRIRFKNRNLDSYLKRVGKLWLARAFQFYDAPRIVRVSNNPNAQRYFKFHVEKMEQPDGSVQRKAVVTPLGQDPTTGQPVVMDTKEFIINGEFDVKVSTGSGLPFAKTQRLNKAIALFDRGAIDELELLKEAEYPNAEAVFERVQARKAQQAQEAMMAKMAGGAAPSPEAPPPAA